MRTLSASCLPATLEQRTHLARALAEHVRLTPLAVGIVLAATRAADFPEPEQVRDWQRWAVDCFGADNNLAYLHHLAAVGRLLIDAEAMDASAGEIGPVLHATLSRQPYNKLIVLTRLPRPHKLRDFWLEYGAAVPDASREELRDLVDTFLHHKPAKKRQPGPRRLGATTLIDQLCMADPREVLAAAETARPEATVAMVRHSLALVERQAELGRMSAEDLHAAMSAALESLRRLKGVAAAMGIVTNKAGA